jgi:hypothetical protein
VKGLNYKEQVISKNGLKSVAQIETTQLLFFFAEVSFIHNFIFVE